MRAKLATGIAVLALVAGGCGGSAGSSDVAGGGSGELTPVNVGYVPYADDVALFLAKEKGIFEKNGLDATLTPAQSPTAVVASMVSGQEQFGFITTPVLVNATAKGTPLKCVSTVDGQTPTDPEQDGTALVSARDSGITSVRDLAGKKVAVVQLSSLNSTSMRALALDNDMDPASIQLIQLPFPQMPAALQQGRVDAAVIVSPFLNTAIANGAHVINHPNVELFGGGTVVCFASTAGYVEENPDVVEAFAASINAATIYAGEHEDEAKATLPKYLELTPEQAQQQTLSTNFDPTLKLESIEQIQSYLQQLGEIDTVTDPAELVWSGAKTR